MNGPNSGRRGILGRMSPGIPQASAPSLAVAGNQGTLYDVSPLGPGPARGAHSLRLLGRWRYRTLISIGLVLIAGVGAWQIYASVWSARSTRTGRSLVRNFLAENNLASPLSHSAATSKGTLVSCRLASTKRQVRGLLEIPKLDVVAPVEQNEGDAQLNVAVGHNPYSVWPGTTGTSVLVAHDVSYFENLPHLNVGDEVIYVAPCRTYYFRVESHAIVSAGAPVYNTARPSLTLVTCWPTNALWFTPDRYVLSATFIGTRPTTSRSTSYLAVTPPPSVAIPPPLAAQGVTLTTYSLPMGSFALVGKPNAAWAQTTSPLLDEDSAVQSFIAAVRALTENRLEWWRQLAPDLAPPPPLIGASNPGYNAGLDVTVTAYGTTATRVALQDTITISGGPAPGAYVVSVVQLIRHNSLSISSWKLRRA
ncbi:MAG: class D sortase [Acidimicrobiales bacterium]